MSDHTLSPIEMSRDEKLRMYVGSFWIFIIAEAIMFVTLFSTRFLLAGTMRSNELNQGFGITSTILMLLGAFTVQRGLKMIQSGLFKNTRFYLNMTALLGLIVMVVNGYEWLTSSMDWGSRFGEVYYIITLFHELHLLGGLVALVAIAIQANKQRFSSESYWPVKAIQVYWMFVTVVWLCVYISLYLI
ncbi:MAG: cytochrome c oxidase subunit 3 [Bacillota bacterium]|nr:cytochrome c oxidase subunit 3 [Bacillota bacterium]MDP4154272.1 cytochrome c oxidase subunit 3 [Bacillota bacterium]